MEKHLAYSNATHILFANSFDKAHVDAFSLIKLILDARDRVCCHEKKELLSTWRELLSSSPKQIPRIILFNKTHKATIMVKEVPTGLFVLHKHG